MAPTGCSRRCDSQPRRRRRTRGPKLDRRGRASPRGQAGAPALREGRHHANARSRRPARCHHQGGRRGPRSGLRAAEQPGRCLREHGQVRQLAGTRGQDDPSGRRRARGGSGRRDARQPARLGHDRHARPDARTGGAPGPGAERGQAHHRYAQSSRQADHPDGRSDSRHSPGRRARAGGEQSQAGGEKGATARHRDRGHSASGTQDRDPHRGRHSLGQGQRASVRAERRRVDRAQRAEKVRTKRLSIQRASFQRAILVILAFACLTLVTARPAWPADEGMIRIDVTLGKSQVVQLKEPFTRVSVTNPNVADVFVVTPNQILINGKTPGVRSLVVFYPTRTMFFDVAVQNDLALLAERLKQIAPREEIQVQPAQDAIILKGSVANEQMIAGAVEIASMFAPKGRVVNLLSVSEVNPQQVMLQVHVAEVAREALKELGFSIRALGSTLQGGTFPGIPFFPPLGTLGAVSPSGSAVGRSTPDFLFTSPQGGSGFFLSSGKRDYAGLVQALSERSLLRTLAKPNLVTQSGKEAKFLSGGEFPFPVAQQNNTTTIEFKEFGVGLLFTPMIVDGVTINLRVRPEVSSLDFSQGLQVSGFNIPVIRKNEAFTHVSLKDGESFAIAGLINNEVRQTVAKIPVLGDIPILGTLFRSSRCQNNEPELLVLGTVKLVKAGPSGSAGIPDPTRLMELRREERKEFTLTPGFPGVGEVVDRPFGQSNLQGK